MLAAALGAALNGLSATLVRLSHATPSTAAAFRCLYALPFLGVLAYVYHRAAGPTQRAAPRFREWTLWLLVGFFFALDLVLWNVSVGMVGAGIATVLVNAQAIFVGLAGWLLGEPPQRRVLAALPILFGALVMVSGVLGGGSYGHDPVAGTAFGLAAALAYAVYLITLRRATRSPRPATVALFTTTTAAGLWGTGFGLALGDFQLTPLWPMHGWLLLLAFSGQVAGWILVTLALPRLPIAVTSMVLLVQPATALVYGAVILGERPSPLQCAGAVLILVVVVWAGRTGPRPASADTDPTRSPDRALSTSD
ncbi:hypothetical protein GCM10012275_20680 [Longimycelium tulufanense]|uniref:EamA domain-containing protein n=1 Tax=Longimycelium tulufanense TaxID=907463 RepID=A0A8J3FW21_9PSEU|nr:hypothetical protein GCM10012275_20680 [Longimycelium tulufanense]